VALIMLDIDSFKQINDRLGHQKGDEILRNVTDRCTRAAGQDNVYRYGGDDEGPR
jgi:diguanylate cyclase (GGDEF)-like protein